MKLIRMHVDNFGGLHNYDYAFDEGLNVILHDNGWGKTTMAAFLKAMLYGYDTKRSRDITENERKRYLPWQGGKYGGSLDFEAEGVRYRITRTFGETPRFDTVKIVNLDTNAAARIPPDKIGETLFHLDASAFQRSVFITHNGLSIDGAASSIHTRLNALVSQANDVAAFDGAIARLTQQVKVYEKTGARGQLGDLTRKIAELELLRDQLERDIANQEAARERIMQIDVLLGQIDKALAEKNLQLDAAAGESRKQEAERKLLEDLRGQIAALQQEMDAIAQELGGNVPTSAQIDQNKRYEQIAASLKTRLSEFGTAHEALERDYAALLQKHSGALPTPDQLDEIQGVYGEIQGILTAGAADAAVPEAPETYRLIRTASEENPAFVDQLQQAIDSRASIQTLMHQQETQARDMQREAEDWTSRQKRFAELKAERDALQAKLAAQAPYLPAIAEPAVRSLEQCQKKQSELSQLETDGHAEMQREREAWAEKKKRYEELKAEAAAQQAALDGLADCDESSLRPALERLEALRSLQQRIHAKSESLASLALTQEEEALIAHAPESLPDAQEGAAILGQYRSAVQHQAEVQGLRVRLDGERSKEDSLQASLAQLESMAGAPADAVGEPKKSTAGALIGAGIVIAIAGIALGIAVSPVLAVLAAVGVVLCILGIASGSSYNKKLQAYRQAEGQRREAQQKEEKLRLQLASQQAVIASLKRKIKSLQGEFDAESRAVNAWIDQWDPSCSTVSEDAIRQILEWAADVQLLRKKQADAAAVQDFVNTQTAVIRKERTAIDRLYPVCAGKSAAAAMDALRAKGTDHRIAAERLQTARGNLTKFIADAKVSEQQLAEAESPRLSGLQSRMKEIAAERDAAAQARARAEEQYPEIAGLTFEAAIAALRGKANAYAVIESQLNSADRALKRFAEESGIGSEDPTENSPRLAALKETHRITAQKLEQQVQSARLLLRALDLDAESAHILQALRDAETMLGEYRLYEEKLKDTTARTSRKQEQLDTLERRLRGKLAAIHMQCADEELPAALAAARADAGRASQTLEKMADAQADMDRLRADLDQAQRAIGTFTASFGHFTPEGEGMLGGIYARAHAYSEKLAAKQELEKQSAAAGDRQQSEHTEAQPNTEEAILRAEIERLKERRDGLLIEYTQKSDAIRLADQSLERYPDLLQEIRALYEQKQKAQNTLGILKRTIQLITRAKENLANRYLSRVEQLFNSYMQIWLNNDAVRGLLDVNFNVSIEENDKIHVAEGYSTGYCDIIDFCMRLALVDTLFEKEQPFLILDDPFVNLDAERLEKALELLNVMAANRQIVYFVCHPIRAAETEKSSASRAEFLALAEAARASVGSARAEGARSSAAARKSPKEMYRVVQSAASHAIRPANPKYTITNSIFSMSFVLDPEAAPRDDSFELFFIDAVGHVLNDRQMLEIRNGKLSSERVQFSLNTRDDSGSEYELMIRRSGQDDYEVVARYPFRAKLAFAGTFSFDL